MATIINGKKIASILLGELKNEVEKLKTIPTLVVIQIGQNPVSSSYINQKQKAADKIGVKLIHLLLEEEITPKRLSEEIERLNRDNNVHGIILQRPLTPRISKSEAPNEIRNDKDVDGFNPDSPFTTPVVLAVLKVLETIKNTQGKNHAFGAPSSSETVLVLGAGETGGGPVHKTFTKLGIKHQVADINTPEKERLKLIKNADILISCVGKPNLVNGRMIKKGAVCIGVGISRINIETSPNTNFKLLNTRFVGDFDESTIYDVAAFYTPTPGGTGPLNVAFLMKNLVKAAKEKKSPLK